MSRTFKTEYDHPNHSRRKAAELFERGYGYKATASELGLNRETIRDWYYTWRAMGTEELLSKNTAKRNRYSTETKIAAVKDREAGMSVVAVMKKYSIPNRHRLNEWMKIYRKSGEAGFK